MTNYYSDQMATSKIYGWHLYVLSVPGFTKVGTASRLFVRLPGLQSGNPHRLKVEAVWHFKCRNEARAVERCTLANDAFKRLPKSGWGDCDPAGALAIVENIVAERRSDASRLEDWSKA